MFVLRTFNVKLTYRYFSHKSTPLYSKLDNWLNGHFKPSDTTESQSDLLCNSSSVFELQVAKVKLEFMSEYLTQCESLIKTISNYNDDAKFLGSWTCDIGDQNSVYHLWQYPGGYPSLSTHYNIFSSNKELLKTRQNLLNMLYSFENQICLPFSYWPLPHPRSGPGENVNIYEIRSYSLKPGTMLEWGNHWARTNRLNKNMEAVAGLFTHIGDLQVIHHIWVFKDLEARNKSRDENWQDPTWSKCVMGTVPLIRHMKSSILRPTSYSLLR